MASTARVRRDSMSSLSALGSDNAESNVKGRKALQELPSKGNKNIVQRTRDALGDIGNRLVKKNNSNTGKPGNAMKKVTALKSTVDTFKSSENLPVASTKLPKAGNKQENPKKQATKSTNQFVPGLAASKITMNKDVKAKVFTNLPRSQSTKVKTKVDPALKTVNKTVLETKNPNKGSNSQVNEKENDENVPVPSNIQKSVKDKVETIVVNTAVEVVDDSVTLFEKVIQPDKVDVVLNLSTEKQVVESVYSSERFEVLDIDAVDEKNPLLVKEYILDICEYLFSLEKKYPVRIRYLEGRLVNSRMRAVLLDWLIEVHQQFCFMPETLYMAAKTMDRYMQKERRITRKQLQLVGVTSMYIAAKFEEVCTPTVLDFSTVSDNAFTVADIRHMEREILHALDFDLAAPPAVFFLRRFSKAAGVSSGMVLDSQAPMIVHAMAKYIMELTVVDYSTCHLFPSEQAASALALSMLIMDKTKTLRELWTPTLEHYTKVPLDWLKRIVAPVASVLAKIHEEPPKLKAIHTKYARNRLSRVSLSPELHVDEWKSRVLKDLC